MAGEQNINCDKKLLFARIAARIVIIAATVIELILQ